jgi:putative membrane protein
MLKRRAVVIGSLALALSAAPAFAGTGRDNPRNGPHSQPNGVSSPAVRTLNAADITRESNPDSHASTSSTTTGPMSQAAFIRDTAQNDMAEVQLGALAQQKTQSEALKKFAGRMVEDHGDNELQLRSVAHKEHVNWPQSIRPAQQQFERRLLSLNGHAFDQAYIDAIVKDQQEAIARFQKESAGAVRPDMKKYVQKSLPKLEKDLALAKKAQQQVGA